MRRSKFVKLLKQRGYTMTRNGKVQMWEKDGDRVVVHPSDKVRFHTQRRRDMIAKRIAAGLPATVNHHA